MDNQIQIEKTIFNNYDTVILDLDGVVWDCFSPSGSGVGAYATDSPYTLENDFFVKDVNGCVIRLSPGVREVIQFLADNDRNLGIMSAGEKDDTPYDAQPSIMLLKKFDLLKYFNYDVIIKRLDNIPDNKGSYVKPLGKTLFIDDRAENLQDVSEKSDIDTLSRKAFQAWIQLLQPVNTGLKLGSQKLADYFFGDDDDDSDDDENNIFKFNLDDDWRERQRKFIEEIRKEREEYEKISKRKETLLHKELPEILKGIMYSELPIQVRQYVETRFASVFTDHPEAKAFLESVTIDILPRRSGYGNIAEYFKDTNRIEFYYSWQYDNVIHDLATGKKDLSNAAELRAYFIDKYFNRYIIHELVHSIQNFFTSNNLTHSDVAAYPDEEHPEYYKFGDIYHNDPGEVQAREVAEKFKFNKAEEKARKNKYGLGYSYSSELKRQAWLMPKNLKVISEELSLPEGWRSMYAKNKFSEKLIIAPDVSKDPFKSLWNSEECPEDMTFADYELNYIKQHQGGVKAIALNIASQLRDLGVSGFSVEFNRAGSAASNSIAFKWDVQRSIMKRPREVIRDLIDWDIRRENIYNVRGSAAFIKIFLKYPPQSPAGLLVAKKIIDAVKVNYGLDAFVSTDSRQGAEVRHHIMVLIPNKIQDSAAKFSWQLTMLKAGDGVCDAETGENYRVVKVGSRDELLDWVRQNFPSYVKSSALWFTIETASDDVKDYLVIVAGLGDQYLSAKLPEEVFTNEELDRIKNSSDYKHTSLYIKNNLRFGVNNENASEENTENNNPEGSEDHSQIADENPPQNNEEAELAVYYPDVDDLIEMHDEIIGDYGGRLGIIEGGQAKLEAAIGRMQSGFSEEEFYPSIIEKAAVLVHSIVTSHPFVDGNKRTGFIAALEFLHFNGFVMGESERFADIIIQVANDEGKYEHLLKWLQENSHSIQDKHKLTIHKLTSLKFSTKNHARNLLALYQNELAYSKVKYKMKEGLDVADEENVAYLIAKTSLPSQFAQAVSFLTKTVQESIDWEKIYGDETRTGESRPEEGAQRNLMQDMNKCLAGLQSINTNFTDENSWPETLIAIDNVVNLMHIDFPYIMHLMFAEADEIDEAKPEGISVAEDSELEDDWEEFHDFLKQQGKDPLNALRNISSLRFSWDEGRVIWYVVAIVQSSKDYKNHLLAITFVNPAFSDLNEETDLSTRLEETQKLVRKYAHLYFEGLSGSVDADSYEDWQASSVQIAGMKHEKLPWLYENYSKAEIAKLETNKYLVTKDEILHR